VKTLGNIYLTLALLSNKFKLIQILRIIMRSIIYCIIILLFPSGGYCIWDADPTVNIPVCEVSGGASDPRIIEDDNEGFFAVWVDDRTGSGTNIYSQRVNSFGDMLWPRNGIPVTRAANDQLSPVLLSDGSGGMLVFWIDYRNGNADIYGQRMDSSGSAMWATNGVPVCEVSGDQLAPQAIMIGSAISFVVWEDFRSDPFGDIYIQKVSASGSVLWSSIGIGVCSLSNDQWNPQICWDRADGCFVVWEDFRNGLDTDVFGQRINSIGTHLWTANGVPVFKSAGTQSNMDIVSDQVNGFIAIASDNRWDPLGDIAAQRIDTAGSKLWGFDGIFVERTIGFQTGTKILSDEVGGVIVSWIDGRDNLNGDIYSQRLSNTGAKLWGAASLPVNTEPEVKKRISMTWVKNDYAIINWEVWYSPFDIDLFAQKVDVGGTLEWAVEGRPLSTALEDQIVASTITDFHGGAFCAWQDFRNDAEADIYCQRIFYNGNLADPFPAKTLPFIGFPCLFIIGLILTVLFRWK